MQTIPPTMKALVLEKYGAPPIYVDVPVPRPGHSEILVKVIVSPINPADLSFMKGYYSSQKKIPVTLGSEGAGIVVDAGADPYAMSLIGKKVSILVEKGQHGCFAEYAVSEAIQAIPFPDNYSFEEGASGLVNPLSVVLMYKKVQEREDRAVVNNPAASALGRMLYRICKHSNIPVINIVRRKEQANLLKAEEGCEHILITDDPNFEEDLRTLSEKLDATISFDAVGGPLAGVILKNMPDGSTAYIYGNLSMKNSEASQFDLIFKKKKIKGFWLSTQLKRIDRKQLLDLYAQIGPMYKDVLATKYIKKYPLFQIGDAVRFYLKHMSEGKILLSTHINKVEEIPYAPQARL
ncbi:hypothetical protein ABPG72_001367 [Tetrahymena utriculariae]